MRRLGAAAVGAAMALSGCVYYNALYNAERLFMEGETYRREGRDSLADARYADVVRKAAKGFRQEPDGEWADEALLLMGRAYLRLGEVREARAALTQASEKAGDEQGRLAAELNLGVSMAMAGDMGRATGLLNRAIQGLSSRTLRAEGHLWRGRALLTMGEVDAGWWDLDQAATDEDFRLEASLARVDWGVRLGNRDRVQEGVNRLLGLREAGLRVDTVARLVRAAADRWGDPSAAELLAGADTARWARTPRGMIRLTRATLLRAAGDTALASAEVRRVADGIGPSAAQARLDLAAWQLAQARDLVNLRDALPILLPAVMDPEVARMAADVQLAVELSDRGLQEPLAWFAAAEVARERLGATELAQGLLLAYVDAAPSDPWVPKALLAALALSEDEGDRAWLRGRLEGRADSPYVLAASGEPALGLEALEEELARRFQEMIPG